MNIVRSVLFLHSSTILWPANLAAVTNETRQLALSITNVKCRHDSDVVLTPFCRLKAIARGSSMLTFGGILNSPINDVMVNLKHFMKNSKNIYMPGIYDVTIDACKASDVFKNPIVNNLLPKAKDLLGKILKDCPYQGEHKIELLLDTSNFPPIGPSGHNRLDVTILANKTRWIFKLSVFSTSRNEKWFRL